MHTRDFAVGQPEDIVLKENELVTGGQNIQPVDRPLNKEYLDELAFMEEPVEIMVQETTDQNAENPVTVGCNGVFVSFFRGVATVAKRKFVNQLIVKSSSVSTPEYINNAGERARAIRQTHAMKYPFQVIQDKNPKGVEWLRRRMAEAV